MRTLIIAALCVGAEAAAAQNTRSPFATVSQAVMSSKIDIVYRRPVARGRTLFGSLVKWGETWTPSADTALRITFSTPVEVNGSKLAGGTYSLWSIPDSLSWTMIFSNSAVVFHRNYPGEGRDALRVKVAPANGEHVETLMFAFPMVDADSARLEMRWGTTIVPLSIKVVR
jgi:hypothetical protein